GGWECGGGAFLDVGQVRSGRRHRQERLLSFPRRSAAAVRVPPDSAVLSRTKHAPHSHGWRPGSALSAAPGHGGPPRLAAAAVLGTADECLFGFCRRRATHGNPTA